MNIWVSMPQYAVFGRANDSFGNAPVYLDVRTWVNFFNIPWKRIVWILWFIVCRAINEWIVFCCSFVVNISAPYWSWKMWIGSSVGAWGYFLIHVFRLFVSVRLCESCPLCIFHNVSWFHFIFQQQNSQIVSLVDFPSIAKFWFLPILADLFYIFLFMTDHTMFGILWISRFVRSFLNAQDSILVLLIFFISKRPRTG